VLLTTLQNDFAGLFGAVPRDVGQILGSVPVDLYNANNQVGGRRLSACQLAGCRRALCWEGWYCYAVAV
jgi:hypothetical protein